MPVIKRKIKDEYLLTDDGLWIRNFCKPNSVPLDINRLIPQDEYTRLLENELENVRRRHVPVESDVIVRPKVVIASDGHEFVSRQKMLLRLPAKDVAVMGVNKSLAKWDMVGDDLPESDKRAMAFYVTNNPFPEATNLFSPKNYFPKCIASLRTNPEFLRRYRGNVYVYAPATDQNYSGVLSRHDYMLDDYRNPVCAALCLAYRFKAKEIVLFCCDDSFEDERPGAVRLENGLWSYPQHLVSNRIIDGCVYWLRQAGVRVANFSQGPKLKNADYINSEQEMISFFTGRQ